MRRVVRVSMCKRQGNIIWCVRLENTVCGNAIKRRKAEIYPTNYYVNLEKFASEKRERKKYDRRIVSVIALDMLTALVSNIRSAHWFTHMAWQRERTHPQNAVRKIISHNLFKICVFNDHNFITNNIHCLVLAVLLAAAHKSVNLFAYTSPTASAISCRFCSTHTKHNEWNEQEIDRNY